MPSKRTEDGERKTDPKDTRMTQEIEIMFLFIIILLERFAVEGNGNPLQCSCLENPRNGGAWWAAVYGVAQSRTRLKRLKSSSSSRNLRTQFTH